MAAPERYSAQRSSSYSIPRKPVQNGSRTSSYLDTMSISSQKNEYRQATSTDVPYQTLRLPSPVSIEGDLELPDSTANVSPSMPHHSSSIGIDHTPLAWNNTAPEYVPVGNQEHIEASISTHTDAMHNNQGQPFVEDEDTLKRLDEIKETEVESNEDRRMEPLPIKDLPDWRPRSLGWSAYLVILIVVILIIYAVLYARSKLYGIITPLHSRYDWLYRFGPAFLAVLILESIQRMVTDLYSVLPYVALAAGPRDPIRSRPLARLTETRWYDKFHANHLFQATSLLIRYCTFIFVPLQSTLLSSGSRHYKTETRSFQVVGPDVLISSLNHTLIPALGLDSIWHGQPVADFKWLAFMDSNDSDFDNYPIQPDYAGIMPFTLTASNHSTEPSQSQTWDVTTSAIYGYMNCTQIDNISLSVGHIWFGASGLQTTNLHISLVDRDGCMYEQAWKNTTSSLALGVDNPITSDGRLALWQTLGGHQGDDDTITSCSRHTHFIASGPLSVPYDLDPKNASNKADTGPGTGWAALKCVPNYRVITDNVTYSVEADDQEAATPNKPAFGEGELLPIDDERLNGPLERNILDNNLIYNLSSPMFRRTFWNAPLPNAFGSLADVFSQLYDNTDLEGCTDVTTENNEWDNNNACQMYLNVVTLWPLLVAGTVSLSALYIPLENQITKQGEVHFFRTGWYLTGWELTYTIPLHLFIIFMLAQDRVLHFPNWFRHILPSGRSPESRYKTGLYGTASSIAGLVFVFQDRTLYPLFERLDTMKPSLAVRESRRRFQQAELFLRKWNILSTHEPEKEADGESNDSSDQEPVETVAMIRPRDGILKLEQEDVKEPSALTIRIKRIGSGIARAWSKVKFWQNSDRNARRLRYGRVPHFLNPVLLLFILVGTIVIIVIVYKYIVVSHASGYQMWFQPTYALSQRFRDDVKRYLQKALFKGLPTLVLLGIGFWWENVERYYRATQPYAALAKGANGKMSVCLDYIHGFHITTSWKAMKNKHYLLMYVTFTTFIVKMGIVLASGIFTMNEIGSKPGYDLPLSRALRNETFVDELDSGFTTDLRRFALSRAVFGYPRTSGWQFGEWVFPSVDLDGPQFQLNISGLAGALSCSPVETTFEKQKSGNFTATLKEGECADYTWPNVCLPETNPRDAVVANNVAQTCMSWRYIDPKSCSKLNSTDTGRWWITSVNGTVDRTKSGQSILDRITQNISVVCEPLIYNGSGTLSVTRKSGAVWTDEYDLTLETVPNDHWKGAADSSLTFSSFAAKLLNDTFAGTLYSTTDEGWYDYFSIISVLASNGGTDIFLTNATTLMSSASSTYSKVFAALISQNLQRNETKEDSTILLESLTTRDNSTRPFIFVKPFAQMATVALPPLYWATAILVIYCLGIFCIWPRRHRRMPLDISYPANAMTLVYDSYLLELVKNSGRTSDFQELHDMQFAIGHYQGRSGEARIGIDVREIVQEIDDGKGRGGSFCC
ncbi:hypothetical protein BDV96DRAFT_637807 [Lophiotrema nucula]|uniref:Uncharacterized protein n=1 Tax=Lophiotrema nucula TaxID=690887 RepID=A0A6A5YL09_9PLEO|nr:hypothetical protein BDV96DRAFT_637807 [Lophiotrema nucula]